MAYLKHHFWVNPKLKALSSDYFLSNGFSIAKIVCTENNFRCADIGLQVLGGAGYSMEYDMQMFLRDSRVGPIGGGSNEIQRNVIAKQMDLRLASPANATLFIASRAYPIWARGTFDA